YPKAYKIYHEHCVAPKNPALKLHQQSLVGTTLLIPPIGGKGGPHWIACLFTSEGYGQAVSSPETILENTKLALEDLAKQIDELRSGEKAVKNDEGEVLEVGGCWSVRINSGMFRVKWERTLKVLKEGRVDLTVVRPEGESDGGGDGGKETRVSEGVAGKRSMDAVGGKRKRAKGDDTAQRQKAIGGLEGWLK
ncbi:MAG: hypothetical protein Q9217_002187, partial [Psora testacea]